ncbi:hypothetical protein BS78_08G044200 [Paspalum vaginatum]|nr:hypothetical protein BS78_08G044200 [Paspalum vaginatum]
MAQHHHPEDPLAWVPSTDVDASDPSIEWLRGRDLDRAGANTFRGVPVTSSNAGWRRINFVYPGRPTVSILIDEVDSYVVAIMPADGTWLQFSDRAIPQGVNATVLGFSSSYIRLLDDINSVDIVFGTPVGTPVLTNVYHVLSNFNPQLV